MRCGAFTVRSTDMHAFKFILWIAEPPAKLYGIGQVLFESRRPVPREHRELAVEVVESGFIVHDPVGSSLLAVASSMHAKLYNLGVQTANSKLQSGLLHFKYESNVPYLRLGGIFRSI
jgi:hypothetical protein